MAVEGLVHRAASLLGHLELVDDLTFSSRAHVARLRSQDGTTVIVKAPLSPGALERELQALRTLPESVRPSLVATGNGLVVMEDLGAGPSLADILLSGDASSATDALLAWARALATALKATLHEGREDEAEADAPDTTDLRLLAGALGVPVPAGLEDDAAYIAAALARPGKWLALRPGDTCPDNNRVTADGSVRLFDFEGSGWRHAAREAAYCRTPFCTCWCVAKLPDGLTQHMEDAFLDVLSPPERERFVDVIDLAATGYTLASFGWFRRFVLENRAVGPPDRAPCTGRQYVYERLLLLATQRDQLPSLAALAEQLAPRILERWPEAAACPPTSRSADRRDR